MKHNEKDEAQSESYDKKVDVFFLKPFYNGKSDLSLKRFGKPLATGKN